jgi:cold shock CspA family protein
LTEGLRPVPLLEVLPGAIRDMARIKSFSKEKGFGYIDHPELGDLLFDFEACNFRPEVGDEVDVVEIGKRFDGSPKAKKVICPGKSPG